MDRRHAKIKKINELCDELIVHFMGVRENNVSLNNSATEGSKTTSPSDVNNNPSGAERERIQKRECNDRKKIAQIGRKP